MVSPTISMRNKLFFPILGRSFWVLLICTQLFVHPVAAATKEPPIRIAITPCTEVAKTFKLFHPLAVYLEKQVKRPVSLVIPKDFQEYERFIMGRETDFAFQAPHTYVKLASHYNQELLLKALTPEGETRHRGVIIVRKDSPLKRIEDLKGKRVLFGAENDMAKSLASWRLLEKHGIRPDKDLAGYQHDGSCESIALNVFLKAVDAGAVCDFSFEEINAAREGGESEIPAGQLRILGQTDAIPTWVFSSLKGVDQELVRKVNTALTGLSKAKKEHQKVLEKAEVGGFVLARDSDFDEVRKVVPTSSRTHP